MPGKKSNGNIIDKDAFNELVEVLAAVDKREEVKAFLECILTPNELYEITTRWALVRLIDEGVSQRKIAERLGLSLCKITRGSKELKKPNSGFRIFIDRFKGVGKTSE